MKQRPTERWLRSARAWEMTGQSAFVIPPAYLQEQYPDLDSVEDLKDERFKALFATPEAGRQGRLSRV